MSVTCTPQMSTSRSSPHAIASRSVSSAAGGPSVNTVTREPGRSAASSHAFAHRAPAVRIHLELDAVAPQAAVFAEFHLFELRDLLYEHGKPHTIQAMARQAVIVDCARSAFGKRKGALAEWHPTDLLGLVLRALVERNDIDPARIDDVVGGCVTQAGEQGCNVTRNAWVAAGLPWSVPATSVDRQCGSSQQAAHFVAQGVIAGAYDIGIACGVESMTRSPMASNARGGDGPFSGEFLVEHEQHARHPVLGRAGARRQVGHHARRDGRVRAPVPPTGRGKHRQRVLRG